MSRIQQTDVSDFAYYGIVMKLLRSGRKAILPSFTLAPLGLALGSTHAPLYAAVLPYSIRSQDYSAWTAATRGDINTIGMGGATLAVPSSIAAAETNSAGYAMQTGSLSAQINQITLHDESIQRSGEPFDSSQWGLAVSPPPWGFGVAYYSPMTETGEYLLPGGSFPERTEVSIKEFRFTAARSFMKSRLALGASLGVEKAVRELGAASFNAWGWSAHFGALYRLDDRVIIGARFAPEVRIGPSGDSVPPPGLGSFDRTIVIPTQAGLGIGWVPNRFFKAGASLNYVAATRGTALLADQTVATGGTATFIPRVGASYVLAEFRNFKMEAAAGAYFEPSRLSDRPSRFHGTAALELNPYFVNLGGGFDLASRYKNVMVSLGIDLVRTLRTFEIIPKDPVPPYGAFWPKMDRSLPDGLPGGLTEGEKKTYQPPSVEDVGKIVAEIPGRIAAKLGARKRRPFGPMTREEAEAEDARSEKEGRNSGSLNLSP